MERVNYYKLGRRYARRPFEDPFYENLPTMNFDEMAAFNRGYDDALNGPSIGAKLFVAALGIIIVLAIIGFVK